MEKEKAPQWILWFVLIQLVLLSNTHPDFISIDCGERKEYPDPQTGILYQTDIGFVETGINKKVADEEKYEVDYALFGRQLQTLRSFPEGKRNCYTLKPKQGKNNNYLIRAFFAYGNYDAKNKTPSFDLYLNVDFWTTMDLDEANDFEYAEIIHTPTTDTIHVCLVNTERGTPFMSTLELRPLANSIYNLIPSSPSQSLLVSDTRINVGSIPPPSDSFKRFKDDIYDRVWREDDTFVHEGWQMFNRTSENIDAGSINDSYKLPTEVLMSATKSLNLSFDINIDYDSVWVTPTEKSYRYYVIFHFFEIEKLPTGQKRVIDITVNGKNIHPEAPITLEYLKPVTVTSVTDQDGLFFNISATSESDAPPILNAIETYKIMSSLASPTHQTDADAILDIKNTYGILKVDWQGDPCVPMDFSWEGLRCRYDGINNTNPRIISLNLSASKLRGQIAPSFSQLTELQYLDLSSNDLSGSIPEFLAKLPNLTILNLSGNRLTGSVPKALKEKSGLEMSLDDNPSLCLRDPCQKHKFLIPLIASVSALTVVILISLGVWIFKIKKLKVSTKQNALELRNRAYSYTNVLEITHNLQHLIGEGGFGKVYLGTLKNCTQVAVKLLSHSSVQGHREFRSEVELLMVIHHRHLVSLIGYCEESDVRALIYEYMPNGNLHHHLSSNKGGALKWKDRLQIALEAAYGLDYLHNGCKPAIVHRDLKASNILLDRNMEAKIADFGLSRAFANDIDTHLSTRPAGTIGYLDPQFQNSGNLTKGSDVYSFGIILLELVTGKAAAKRLPNNTFTLLLEWVTPKLGRKDDIKSIIDPRLQGQYSLDSAVKFIEVAKSCTGPLAIQRPDISQVVVELRECLAMEIRNDGTSHNTNSSSSLDMSTLQLDSSFSALSAR